MGTGRMLAVLLSALVGTACLVAPAGAEWALDVYGGVIWVQKTDVHANGSDNTGRAVDATIFDIETNAGFTAGLRGGYWFERRPFPALGLDFGLGLDFFYFQVPIPAQTVRATGAFTGTFLGEPIDVVSGTTRVPQATLPGGGFSPELRLRWPLMASDAFPKGRLQGYVMAGPAWGVTLKGDNVGLEFGGKVGGGVALQVARFLAVFGEYRVTFFPGFEAADSNLKYKIDLNNHSVIFGVSLRF